MRSILAASVFCLSTQLAAAQAPDTAARATSATAQGSGILLKLGTGVTRGFSVGGYSGPSVPLVLGAEHHLSPAVSVYGNAFSGFNLGRPSRRSDGSRASVLGDFGFDAGLRYYYGQEKRQRQGRVAGSFVGNYVALQSTSLFNSYLVGLPYRYSTLTLLWGMQRRIGKYGLFDAYVGAGLARERLYYYAGGFNPASSRTRTSFAPEIGIKFSLGSRLTSNK
ncbi:hypothetical protein GCM10011378_21880 [Hymenobacter glacieicola]|uniref:Outer membrane protein beta-barrel domain-containing protein n=2 Tax=Hymenobacter glacieicola TaxID=1562124 RepID=A0ABQ1WUC0_9BACT|nr:hypothetical protein GCM10011378_21880 [Hymenobacter glacieicola]